MNLKQDRIEDSTQWISVGFDVLIKHLKTIKNSPYAGLMIFVFMVILLLSHDYECILCWSCCIISGVNRGLGKMENLSGTAQIQYGAIYFVFSCLIS
jgi:hypothetical protein